jgi:hypothetical protein
MMNKRLFAISIEKFDEMILPIIEWHSVFMRFCCGNERGVLWNILMHLQKSKQLKMNIVICDSSTFKYHRHGGGQKGGSNQRAELSLA